MTPQPAVVIFRPANVLANTLVDLPSWAWMATMGDVVPGLSVSLPALRAGAVGITPAFGEALAEAASICFEDRGHSSPAHMVVKGDVKSKALVTWDGTTHQMRRCWNDMQVAVEHGAYGVAVLLVPQISGMSVAERSKKGTGFDYWLGSQADDSPLFQNKARLEVSGILQGSDSIIMARVREKVKQTEQSNGSFPALIIVVEFGQPESRVVNKCAK